MTNFPPSEPPPPPPSLPPYLGSTPIAPSTQPPDFGLIRIFFIVSLIVNSVATLWWLGSTFAMGIATCGVGCLLIILPVVTGSAIVLDAMALSKLNRPDAKTESFLRLAAIMDIVSGVVALSAVPLVMGILNLVHLQKPEVQRYFRRPE